MNFTVGDYSKKLKPRERLIQEGEEALSNEELLAILLSVGTKKGNVYHLAQTVLESFDSLVDLREEPVNQLMKIDGVGMVKACQIRSMIELGKRIHIANKMELEKITSSHTIGNLLIEEMRGLKQENLVVILLDTQNRMIKKKTLFIGTVNQSIAHPREIFREAVRHSATGILIAHNHPSGDTTPSKEDKILTKKIVKNGVMIGIPLLDHLIIGGEKYYSFREQGEIG